MNASMPALVVVGILGLGAGALFSGCASTPAQPEIMRDAQADFSAYETFGWPAAGAAEKSGGTASIVDGHIRTAISNELKSKGYVEATAGTTADLTVEYEAASAEKLKNNPFRIGVGVGSYGSNVGGSVGVGSPAVKEIKEGSLVVHVIDPARKAEVWRGSIARELGKGGVKPEAVQSAVAELLRDFPSRSAPP
ncbi:MAG: DUF4136 domain-containing protein [Steroidobacteraceae bacterium]